MSFLSGLGSAFMSGFLGGAAAETRQEVVSSVSTESRTAEVANAKFAEPIHVERVHPEQEMFKPGRIESDVESSLRDMQRAADRAVEDAKGSSAGSDNREDTDK